MFERIIGLIIEYFNKLRWVLLILLIGINVFLYNELRYAYIPRDFEPLRKISTAEILSDKVKPESITMTVSITGQVKHPGVYELQKGAVINQLIENAGGFTKEADMVFVSRQINLAEKIVDGIQVYIPHLNEKTIVADAPIVNTGANKLISINTASKSEIETLPGIGPATADKIIAGRPYKEINDLLDVSGIGENILEKINELITL